MSTFPAPPSLISTGGNDDWTSGRLLYTYQGTKTVCYEIQTSTTCPTCPPRYADWVLPMTCTDTRSGSRHRVLGVWKLLFHRIVTFMDCETVFEIELCPRTMSLVHRSWVNIVQNHLRWRIHIISLRALEWMLRSPTIVPWVREMNTIELPTLLSRT